MRRAAGTNRTETAKLVADIIGEFNPAFLPVGATAADADLLDGKDSTAFLGTDGNAADADLLDGLDSSHFTRVFFTEGIGPTGFSWGEQLELMRLNVPTGLSGSPPSTGFYDVAFLMDFRNLRAVTAAAGSLTCEVRSGGVPVGSPTVSASTSTPGEFIVLEAESRRFRPVPHTGGFLAVSCINTLEDGAGDPILLEWHGQLSAFRAEQISFEEWRGVLS